MKTMSAEISREMLARLSEYLKGQMGLYFPENRWDELRKKMSQAMKDFDCRDLGGFIEWLMSSPPSRQEIEILASHLTISETYFWREPRVFEALVEQVLPELIRDVPVTKIKYKNLRKALYRRKQQIYGEFSAFHHDKLSTD